MSFAPVIPVGGLVGWQFLQRTYDSQFEAFASSARQQRDIAYFKENISTVTSAKDLVANRRLLEVALGAFGLQDDLSNKYFVQRILSDGTRDNTALAVRLADTRYRQFSDAFGFGPGDIPKTSSAARMDEIVSKFQVQQFEQAVGEQDDSMRIALFSERELARIATNGQSPDTQWFSIMGQPPLRKLFETAFGLPASFGQIDIDKQLGVFKDRAQSVLGNDVIAQFSDPASLDKLITIYQARSQLSESVSFGSPAATALMLLQ